MKSLVSILILLAITSAWGGDKAAHVPPSPGTIQGEVIEVKDTASYTYLRLKTKDGDTWAAITKAPIKKGAKVTIENATTMYNFESKALNQTFQSIVFGNLAGDATSVQSNHSAIHASNAAPALDTSAISVAKATGPNARTVMEIVTKSTELKDKPVVVRGQIVKYSPGIMGKNWVHLRDGSGSAANNSNDILITTVSEAKVGDIATVKGIVRTDKDFGYGYAYKVLIDEASFQ